MVSKTATESALPAPLSASRRVARFSLERGVLEAEAVLVAGVCLDVCRHTLLGGRARRRLDESPRH